MVEWWDGGVVGWWDGELLKRGVKPWRRIQGVGAR